MGLRPCHVAMNATLSRLNVCQELHISSTVLLDVPHRQPECHLVADIIGIRINVNTVSLCHCLLFPEETEGDADEPESRLSWLPASLRSPLVSGYSCSCIQNVFNTFYYLSVWHFYFVSPVLLSVCPGCSSATCVSGCCQMEEVLRQPEA